MSPTAEQAPRRSRRPALIKAAVAVAVIVAAALSTKRVTMTDDAADAVAAEGELATQWVDEIRPAIVDNATDLATVLEALETGEAAANEEYGHAPGAASASSFAVRGTGTAGAVDGSTLPLAVEGVGDGVDVFLQVGPAINGTALRDATGLIDFNDFVNQVEYLNAGTALNELVKQDPLADIDAAALEGEAVRFVGAFTANPTGVVSIVPVELEVAG